jgi:uncharacterized protein (TIGR03089 family)
MTSPISRPDGHLGLLAARRADEGAQRPFVTYYDGTSGERTELGWATFDNWVTKTANLLTEELEVGSGTELLVDLGAHWTTLVIVVATWRVGGVVLLPEAVGEDAAPSHAVVHEDRAHTRPAEHLLVVGSGFGGRLTRHVDAGLPYGEEVLAFPDDIIEEVDGAAGDIAVVTSADGARAEITHGELSRAGSFVAGQAKLGSGDRLLTTVPAGRIEGLAVLAAALVTSASLVMVTRTAADGLSRMAEQERVSAVVVAEDSLAASGEVPPGVQEGMRLVVLRAGDGQEIVTARVTP